MFSPSKLVGDGGLFKYSLPRKRFRLALVPALNETTESVAQRSMYDKLFFYNGLMKSMLSGTRKKESTVGDLRAAYARVCICRVL